MGSALATASAGQAEPFNHVRKYSSSSRTLTATTSPPHNMRAVFHYPDEADHMIGFCNYPPVLKPPSPSRPPPPPRLGLCCCCCVVAGTCNSPTDSSSAHDIHTMIPTFKWVPALKGECGLYVPSAQYNYWSDSRC